MSVKPDDKYKKKLKELVHSNRKLKQAYEEHERLLGAINRVNQLVIASSNLEEMLDQVLAEFLVLFKCDRAWLAHPCDPNASHHQILKEKYRPEWPGANVGKFDIPTDDYASQIFTEVLAHKRALSVGRDHPPPDHPIVTRFNIKSQMVYALFPKIGKPWLLGIHHCAEEYAHSENDKELFEALGGRVADGLSSFLAWQKTREDEALQRAFLNNTSSPICVLDLAGDYLLANNEYQLKFGKDIESLEGKNIKDIFPEEIIRRLKEQDRRVFSEEKSIELEEVLPTASGERYFITVKFPLVDAKQQIYAIGTINTDITERHRAEEERIRLAYFDYLTGLPNRRLLQQELGDAIERSVESSCFGALIFIGLNNFRTLNDTQGHAFGDKLLVEIANVIIKSVENKGRIYRFGGDEFIVLIEKLGEQESGAISLANTLGETIIEKLNVVFDKNEYQSYVSASVGAALYFSRTVSSDELLKRVDSAVYSAKKTDHKRVQFFNPNLQNDLENKARLLSRLRTAISKKEFHLHYQPQINAQGKITGAEALLRWVNPELGFVSPAEFIPLAEESNLIQEIGLWVLEEGCRTLAHWGKSPALKYLTLSLNVSAKQFRQNEFVAQVLQSIKAASAPVGVLKLELTESLEQDDISGNIEKMKELRNANIGLSMDDFGTGFSSLASLRKLPLNQLKIDQSFVNDIGQDQDGETIVKTIIGMGNNLKLEVIAEGVETEEQRIFLMQHGCYNYQGYFFSKPLPQSDFEQFVMDF